MSLTDLTKHIGWISMKSYIDFHSVQTINPIAVGDLLTFGFEVLFDEL